MANNLSLRIELPHLLILTAFGVGLVAVGCKGDATRQAGPGGGTGVGGPAALKSGPSETAPAAPAPAAANDGASATAAAASAPAPAPAPAPSTPAPALSESGDPKQTISAGDQKLIDAWIIAARKGKGRIFSGQGDKRELQFLPHYLEQAKPHTVRYVKPSEISDELHRRAPTATRYIFLDFSVPDEGDEEGFSYTITLAIDASDKVLAAENFGAACPFVYEQLADGSQHFHGEVLRNLRYSDVEQWQPLALTAPAGRSERIVLRIVEEKAETTYLDALALEVGGEQLLPDACLDPGHAQATALHAVCANDGNKVQLRRGQAIEVQFTVPASLATAPHRLWANGYYLPDAR